jgi:hypothetical protein
MLQNSRNCKLLNKLEHVLLLNSMNDNFNKKQFKLKL